MDIKKASLTASLTVCLLVSGGCLGTHFYNRSVVNYTKNRAETYGTISNTPKTGAQSVAAEKTNDFQTSTAISTNSGTATADQQRQKDTKAQEEQEETKEVQK